MPFNQTSRTRRVAFTLDALGNYQSTGFGLPTRDGLAAGVGGIGLRAAAAEPIPRICMKLDLQINKVT